MGNEAEIAIMGFGLEFESTSGMHYWFGAEQSHANTQQQGTSISFTLTDGDAGDEFE